ncbi:DNA-directed RNA polymerase I subunit rpa49 [Rhizophlyctis rosea]|nr:DNA-directed RNA polymerase I subunit rpa49 [Rhizophlyctis rosea]
MASKKRKSTGDVTSQPTEYVSGDVDLPLLAGFPDPPTRPETLYFSKYQKPDDPTTKHKGKRRCIATAETSKLEYVGDNAGAKAYCQYVVGIVDKTTGQITLSSADYLRVSTIVKALKPHESRLISAKNMAARNALGEEFGTKKRRQAIRAQERNQVDVGTLEDIEEVIESKVEQKVMVEKDESAAATAEERNIPLFNAEAQSPEDVYKLESICSVVELKAINYAPLTKCRNKEELQKEVEGMQMGTWTWDLLNKTLKGDRHATRLRACLYLNWMIKMYRLPETGLNAKEGLARKLGSAPELVADNLKSRFTEFREDKGRMKYRMSPRLKDKLLAYILVLGLILDNSSFDVSQVADDLKISITKVAGVAKEVGCNVEAVNGEGVGSGRKKAVLTVPLKFPEQRIRK